MIVLLALLIGGYFAKAYPVNKNQIAAAKKETAAVVVQSSSDISYSDYENLDRKFCGLKTKAEIQKLKLNGESDKYSIKNYHDFPQYAGYYVPKNLVDLVDKIDIDNDKKAETIVYYSCRGCNAPSRNMDIIKDGRVIFSAKGGNMSIKQIKGEVGFVLSTISATLSRQEGYTKVTFKLNEYNEYNPVSQEDVRY